MGPECIPQTRAIGTRRWTVRQQPIAFPGVVTRHQSNSLYPITRSRHSDQISEKERREK